MAWMAPIVNAARQRRQEAAVLMKLSETDPDGRYEFKIIDVGYSVGRHQDNLEQILDIERQGSWEFVENLGDGHIVLRRPIQSKQHDSHLDQDYQPYRTNYNNNQSFGMLMVLGLVLLTGFMAVAGYLVLEQNTGSGTGEPSSPFIIITILIIIVLIAIVVKVKKKL